MQVEVLYPEPDRIWRRTVEVGDGATVEQALQAAGLFESFPAFRETPPSVGIFGRACPLNQVLRDGDRVEVYRPLVFDPMESRRRRARHRDRRSDTKLS